jgi:hypothetical protein
MFKEALRGCVIAGVVGFLLSAGLMLGLRKIAGFFARSGPETAAVQVEEQEKPKPERGRALKGMAQVQFAEQVEASKKRAVARYPELGVRDTAVNREFIRRYKILQSANPSFMESPDWPETLADMMARDLSLDPQQK